MTRRSLTQEQLAARDERRVKFSALAKTVSAMTDEQRQDMAERMAGAVTIEGRELSIHNRCLVACQNPYATLLGGFQQWREHGRVVRKGERGLMIWAPTKGRLEPAAALVENDEPNFILVTMFDVSQTETLAFG